MKKFILFLVGFFPLLVGYALSTSGQDTSLIYFGIVFLILWFIIGRFSYKLTRISSTGNSIGNFASFIAFIFVLVQEIFLNGYWDNSFGFATKLFFEPVIGLAKTITSFATDNMPITYVVAFLMMYLSFIFGNATNNKERERRRRERFNGNQMPQNTNPNAQPNSDTNQNT